MGGNLLQKELANRVVVTPETERRVIVHALLATTLPKLVPSDCQRFEQLVSDAFPQVDKLHLIDDELVDVIKDVLKEMRLQVGTAFLFLCPKLEGVELNIVTFRAIGTLVNR